MASNFDRPALAWGRSAAASSVALGLAALLAGCGGGSGGDNASADPPAGLQLPYDIYLPGTPTGWTHTDANRFRFDAARGVYRLDNLRAGPALADGGRSIKISSAGWTHQFGLGPNGAGTSVAQSTLRFEGDRSVTLLSHHADSKNLYLPLDSDAGDPSGKVLLDLEVEVLGPGATPDVRLTIVKDQPTLTPTLSVAVGGGDGKAATLTYRGDGRYVGTLRLEAGANQAVIQDLHGRRWQGQASAGQPAAALSECSGACHTTLNADDGFYYEVKLDAREGEAVSLSLRRLSQDEAREAAPHFDADGEPEQQVYPAYAAEPGGESATVRVSVADRSAALRRYTLSSTAPQRDDNPGFRVVEENAAGPTLRTGSLLFDGLFAMAVDEARLNSVQAIQDSSYNGGSPVACDCFQTGEKWAYVWTRDLAYAAHLGLAAFDPQRVVNSLLFKTSAWREGVAAPAGLPSGSTQIVQDTGSGGSWPVSTDRVTWAWAADSVLHQLTGAARSAFVEQAYAALRGTLEADREAAFDTRQGLYGGEQSYLDWRTQTYAPWIVNNLARMSSSKALSTNIGHYQALRLAARLATERGESAVAARYDGWAEALKQAINTSFWLDDVKRYASLTSTGDDPAAVYKFDMLGTALAVLSGIASEAQAREALARYPHAPFGPPVYEPQQPRVSVYHNRSLWPFVTAYALRAAARVRNPAVAAHAVDSLMRGAALNLSNMENLEWLTGKPWYDDGPAINSRRQLWSVAGYLGMVTEVMFGYEADAEGLHIRPFLTASARRAMGAGETAVLDGLRYQGRPLKILLHLPAAVAENGYHEAASVRLNGQPVLGPLTRTQLSESANTVEVDFTPLKTGDARIARVPEVPSDSRTDPRVFSPEAPVIDSLGAGGGHLTLRYSDSANEGAGQALRYHIWRDGSLAASGLTARSWTDPTPLVPGRRTCYAVEARFEGSGHRSQHSEPVCWDEDAALNIAVTDARVSSNRPLTPPSDGLPETTLREWGDPGDTLAVRDVQIGRAGLWGVELKYNNHQHAINSGITNAVKLLRVLSADGREVARGVCRCRMSRSTRANTRWCPRRW
ncbi:esterase [Aquabacterium sp. A7-Y]|uniref:MGH1-like glycoside hydrolase domain-containing protein n=1 Tax=Aquabacterium sp. A7-Y TaxID=1349605 RepID=UPI00223CB2A8|nr:esterase [Aquabacterium sp. A7-Y]MCW7540365.1 esterase [Aquabacterium sp. A7-Y]